MDCFRLCKPKSPDPEYIEMTEGVRPDPQKETKRQKGIERLFGLSADQVQELPGISLFAQHLEREYGRMIAQPNPYNGIIPSDGPDCWDWFFRIQQAWKKLEESDHVDPTVKQLRLAIANPATNDQQQLLAAPAVVNPVSNNGQRSSTTPAVAIPTFNNGQSSAIGAAVVSPTGNGKHKSSAALTIINPKITNAQQTSAAQATVNPTIEDQQNSISAQAIVTTLFLLSATLLPVTPDTQPRNVEGLFRYTLRAMYGDTCCSWRGNETLQRISQVLKAMWEWGDMARAIGESRRGLLYAARLNFSSLTTLGNIEIKWVDTLSEHLSFNERDRCLSVFRWPSLCAAVITGSEPSGLVAKIASWTLHGQIIHSHGTGSYDPIDYLDIFREILLSYRLLFSTSRSRKLLQKATSKMEKNGEYVDPFLETCIQPTSTSPSTWASCFYRADVQAPLNTNYFPKSVQDDNGSLKYLEAFSMSDLPNYGGRFLVLQEWNDRQEPRSVKTIYHDFRSFPQWLTLFAVIFFGVGALVMGLGQIGLAGAQVGIVK
ncbi:hypothetical protein BDV19DRAFT_295066 [Aspergillus venezuelensis]